MNTIPLVTFHDLRPALLLRERLEAAGIAAEINDESAMEKYWFMSEPLASVHLEVFEADYDKAAGMLREMTKAEGLISGAVQCPECDSTRVEYPQFSRKFFTPRLGSVLLALRFLPRAFYCLDCHYTWPAAEPIEPKVDVLGWRCDSRLWHPEVQAGRRTPVK
jgi:hypothetical protein